MIENLKTRGFEAVAVSLLWSIANEAHEKRIGELIEEIMPDVPYTLSHQLAPILREYRRASATAIDASLKPLMQAHLRQMQTDLKDSGFAGDLLVSTAVGGCQEVESLVERPINTLKSGPAMAPVAARAYSAMEHMGGDVIVCDTGGTTFDVGLVRDGYLVYSRDSWLGPLWTGDIMGTSTVDVRSVGAGGGSIAWVDHGGLLHVGPQSAGAQSRVRSAMASGGTKPTLTDASARAGLYRSRLSSTGRHACRLEVEGARVKAISSATSPRPLGMSRRPGRPRDPSSRWRRTNMVIKAIGDITVAQGIEPGRRHPDRRRRRRGRVEHRC